MRNSIFTALIFCLIFGLVLNPNQQVSASPLSPARLQLETDDQEESDVKKKREVIYPTNGSIGPTTYHSYRSPSSRPLRIMKIASAGTKVKPGDILIQFESTQIEKAIAETKLQLANSVATQNRMQAEWKSTQVELEGLRKRHELATTHLSREQNLLLGQDGALMIRESAFQGSMKILKRRQKLYVSRLANLKQTGENSFERESLAIDLDECRHELATLGKKSRFLKEALIPFHKERFKRELAQLQLEQATELTKLRNLEVTRKSDFEASRIATDQSESNLQDLEMELKKCVVRAEESGTVWLRGQWNPEFPKEIKPNNLIFPGAEILVVDPSLGKSMSGYACAPEVGAERVKKGRKVSVCLLKKQEELWNGTVIAISKTAPKFERFKIQLENTPKQYSIGQEIGVFFKAAKPTSDE